MKQNMIIRIFNALLFGTWLLVCIHSAQAQPSNQNPELLLQYGHTEDIVGVPAISPDGRLVAAIDGGREVLVWDIEAGRLLRRLKPVLEVDDGGTVNRGDSPKVSYGKAIFSPDGKLLAATGHGSATIWDVESGRLLRVIRDIGRVFIAELDDLLFSPDGKFLYLVDDGGGAIPYDVASGTPLRQKVEFGTLSRFGFSRALAVAADGHAVAVAGRKILAANAGAPASELHWVRLIEGASGKELLAIEHVVPLLDRARLALKGSDYPVAVALSPDGKTLALGGEGAVWLHDAASGRELHRIELTDDVAAGVGFSPDGRLLAISGSRDFSIRLMDAASGKQRAILANPKVLEQSTSIGRTVGGYSKVAFMPDGRRLIATSSRGSLRLIDLDRGDTVRFMGGQTDRTHRIAASRDGRKLAVAGQFGNMIRVWNFDHGRPGATFAMHTGAIQGMTFMPDNRHGVSWTANGEVRLWDAATGRVIRSFDHRNANKGQALDSAKCGKLVFIATYEENVISAAVSADGRFLATSGLDCTLRVWEIATGREIRRFDGIFHAVALSNDGRWLAARILNEGHPLRLWEISNGTELPAIGEASSALIFFDEKNRLVFSGLQTPTALAVWDVAQARAVARHEGMNKSALPLWSTDGRIVAMMTTLTDKIAEPVQIVDLASGRGTSVATPGHRGRPLALAVVPGGCCLAIAGDSGVIQLVDQSSGELIASLVSVREDGDWLADAVRSNRAWSGDDWIVVTPDGLFDGPTTMFNKLLWRFSERLWDIAPGEAFFNEFYRPGLLAEIMAGARPKAPRSLAEVDRRQPQVALQVAGGTERQARVRVDVKEAAPGLGRSAGSGVRDVRLFRNGSLVKRWAGDVAGGAGVLEASVPIIAGENRFTAYAFNRDNIKSGDARAQVTGADSLKRPATAWVLAFGINRYANRAFDLNFSVADAQAFAEQIGQGQTQLGRYQKVNLVSLKDAEATKANLLSALRRLAGKDSGPVPKGAPKALAELKPAQPEDAVFIFFAGHGLADGPRFYLVPHDLGYMGDPEQFDEKARATVFRHAVSDQELEAALETLDAERITLTIDACHSGQALEAEERRRGPMNAKGLAQLAYEKGMYVITAAQSHQAALEFGQLGHGLLTYALVKEGLAQGQADRQPQDGRVEIREWLDYASARVPQLQLEAMRATAQRGRNVAVVRGEEKLADVLQRTLQQPRVFYRREPERTPFVIGGK
ncbi:MAG: caspase family protein [Rhodocyclales bacterium]|nr:caspase family protein [Rhodocyclales bacterium]